MFQPISIFVGLRYSLAREHSFFVSFITWVSLLGVAVGVAQFECGIDVNDRLVPLQLLLVDEFGKQQRRHTLRVRRSHKQSVLVDAFGLAEFAHSESTLVYSLANNVERNRNAGDTGNVVYQ